MSSPFNWQDPFDLDGQLSEDERLVRDSAAAFADGELRPRVLEAFRKELTDTELFRDMGKLGLLGRDAARGIWMRGAQSGLVWLDCA